MPARPFWDHVLIPAAAASRDLDLFFSPLSVVPRFLHVPTVVTVHDLGFLRFQAVQPLKYRWYWRATLQRAARVADRLIAVSQSTALDMVQLLRVDPKKIDMIYEAADPFFLREPSPEEESRIMRSLGLERGYILTVGTLEPRKNYNTVLQVLDRLREQRPQLRLVIVGSAGWLCEDIVRAIRGDPERIRWLDHADNGTLRVLYRGASVFLFPSLYEGFGLPVLEAMACGTPVVTSNASSLPEVAGEAAICTPAQDTQALLRAVLGLLKDEPLREEYRRKGYEQVRRFSWERAAKTTWETFEKALGKG